MDCQAIARSRLSLYLEPRKFDEQVTFLEEQIALLKCQFPASQCIAVNGQRYKIRKMDFEPRMTIGTGSTAAVVEMLHKPSGQIFAVKQMFVNLSDEEDLKRIKRDLDVLLSCNGCPHIVRCYGYMISFNEVWIVMERMNTCFEKLLKTTKHPLSEAFIRDVTTRVVKALKYLKETHEIMHRDVKPSNILMNELGEVKLCDFGISCRLEGSKAKTKTGTVMYLSPERIRPGNDNETYDVRADIWSLGITLIQLAIGRHPFHESASNDFETMCRILNRDPPALPNTGSFSPELVDFTRGCLKKDPNQRYNYKELLEHPFIHTRPGVICIASVAEETLEPKASLKRRILRSISRTLLRSNATTATTPEEEGTKVKRVRNSSPYDEGEQMTRQDSTSDDDELDSFVWVSLD